MTSREASRFVMDVSGVAVKPARWFNTMPSIVIFFFFLVLVVYTRAIVQLNCLEPEDFRSDITVARLLSWDVDAFASLNFHARVFRKVDSPPVSWITHVRKYAQPGNCWNRHRRVCVEALSLQRSSDKKQVQVTQYQMCLGRTPRPACEKEKKKEPFTWPISTPQRPMEKSSLAAARHSSKGERGANAADRLRRPLSIQPASQPLTVLAPRTRTGTKHVRNMYNHPTAYSYSYAEKDASPLRRRFE